MEQPREGAAPAQENRAAADSGLAQAPTLSDAPECPGPGATRAESPHGASSRESLDFQPMSKFSAGEGRQRVGTTSGVLTTLPVTQPGR